MYGLIVGVIIFCALLLILVVLMQNPKGGGLSSQFGGGGASQVMGVKKTGDILEKATWGLAIAIVLLTLSTNFVTPSGVQQINSPNIQNAQDQAAPPVNLPPIEGSDDAQGLDDLNLTDDSDSTN